MRKNYCWPEESQDNTKVTDDMMLMEGEEIEIPEIPGKNTTCKNVRRYLDELARVTFLELNQDEFNGFTDRPSFRDMMAFCYQTQNIVANANTLFIKQIQWSIVQNLLIFFLTFWGQLHLRF